MRRSTVWISALALAVAASAGAAGSKASVAGAGTKPQSKTVELLESTSWNGKKLSVGEYKIVWQEDGSGLKVTVMNGHHVVAEGRGRIEERTAKSPTDAVVSRVDGSGTMALAELQLRGKKEVLVFAAGS
jgi:hypothetical protein